VWKEFFITEVMGEKSKKFLSFQSDGAAAPKNRLWIIIYRVIHPPSIASLRSGGLVAFFL
jgi:hypothetical protein